MVRRSRAVEEVSEEKKEPPEHPEDTSHPQSSDVTSAPPPDYSSTWDDEEAEYLPLPHDLSIEDPYTYSDDSASLSDAYFFPTDDDLIRPPRYREQDPLQYTLATYYGSVLRREQQLPSPLWVTAGSIQEDDVLAPEIAACSPSRMVVEHKKPLGGTKRRRRQRREAQRLRIKQREQIARERAVTQVRGHPQDPNIWRDSVFAIIFLIQLSLVCFCAAFFGLGLFQFQPPSLNLDGHFYWEEPDMAMAELVDSFPLGNVTYADDEQSSTTTEEFFTFGFQNVVALVGITGFYTCVLAFISFGCMLILARALIQVMLVFSVVLSVVWGVIGLTLDPYGVISIMGFFALLLTLGYTIFNWNRIPFAATNLYTALCGIRCTADITILGLVSLVVAFGWCVIWSVAFVGVVNTLSNVDCDHDKDACRDPHLALKHLPVYLLLSISFLWTNTVIKNIVRVTVASAIGTWWCHPHQIRPFCTVAVAQPLFQSLTSSLGSICLGSMVVNLAQVVSVLGRCCCCVCNNSDCGGGGGGEMTKYIEADADSAADSVGLSRRLNGIGSSLGRCLRSCNRWSFTYIGLYHYGFHEGGERAIQLFETREWLDVVHDNLIHNVLLMASMVIGGSTGTFAVVVEETDGYYFSSFHMPTFFAFVIGSTLGYVLSNILLLGVVGSAVNTILVCFAAFPFDFERNHPRLSDELREVWSQQVWEPQV